MRDGTNVVPYTPEIPLKLLISLEFVVPYDKDGLEQSLDLPGPSLVLWAGESPTLGEIEKHAFVPVFAR